MRPLAVPGMKFSRHLRCLRDFIPAKLSLLIALPGLFSVLASAEESAGVTTVRIYAHTEGETGGAPVDLAGLPEAVLNRFAMNDLALSDWQAFFPIYTGDKVPVGKKIPIIGDYSIADGVVRFFPRFPFVKGISYCAKFDPDALPMGIKSVWADGLPDPVELTFMLPKSPEASTTTVSHLFPSRNKLPENLLKFYIHFSAPMSRGDVYDHIHLLSADGTEVEAPFLDLKPELWDPDSRRLTLFFDPGRIKRGLRPHEELGMALQEGNTYRLVVDRNLRDGDGNRLRESFEKKFTVVSADRASPDYRRWNLEGPRSGTRDALTIELDEPLDHALLQRMVTVTSKAASDVPGSATITNDETRWEFRPDKPWEAGVYAVHVEPVIEDLAGNRLFKLFDVDVASDDNAIKERRVEIPFRIE